MVFVLHCFNAFILLVFCFFLAVGRNFSKEIKLSLTLFLGFFGLSQKLVRKSLKLQFVEEFCQCLRIRLLTLHRFEIETDRNVLSNGCQEIG